MSEDREVIREVWEGKIPTCFRLGSEEAEETLQESPELFYLMLPRQSYLPLMTNKVKNFFDRYINERKENEEMWFEYEGVPVQWHLPIGLLYDMTLLRKNANPLDKSDLLPWNLTVRFGNFPEKEIISFMSRDYIESYFMSCIKEADQIKHGGRVVSTMLKKDHHQLWQGLQNDKFDQFWAVNRRLMDSNFGNGGNTACGGDDDGNASSSSIGSSNSTVGFKYIPARVYKADSSSIMIQKLIKTFKEDKAPNTLKDLLMEAFEVSNNEEINKLNVITQGISPPLETPLQWMSEHLSYPDNFLHICVQC